MCVRIWEPNASVDIRHVISTWSMTPATMVAFRLVVKHQSTTVVYYGKLSYRLENKQQIIVVDYYSSLENKQQIIRVDYDSSLSSRLERV